MSFRLETKNPGGHSSLPRPDNAIYQLAAGLGRLSHLEFPAKLNEITRGYFQRSAPLFERGHRGRTCARWPATAAPDPAAAARLSGRSPLYNSLMRTTCVATRLEGGHAGNALPQTARATVNCRVLPGEPIDGVRDEIVRALADPAITVTRTTEPELSQPSSLRPDLLRAWRPTTAALWPGIPVIPTMSTGATDSRFLRNAGIPAYGVSGLFLGPGRRALARTQRAHAGRLALGRPGVPLPPGEDARGRAGAGLTRGRGAGAPRGRTARRVRTGSAARLTVNMSWVTPAASAARTWARQSSGVPATARRARR